MSPEEAEKLTKQFMQTQNNSPVDDFQGLSPFQMHHLIHDPFHPDSILSIKELSNQQLQKIPMFCQVRFLAKLIQKSKELKLTKSGFLPMKAVKETYDQGFIKEYFVERGVQKRMWEDEIPSVYIARILLQVMGITKIRNGKISLTKKAEKLLTDDRLLLEALLDNYFKKFNWGFLDGYPDNQVGKMAGAFSIYLVHKFGAEKQVDNFYAKKYVKAFPMFLEIHDPNSYRAPDEYVEGIYTLRNLRQFMVYFGLIEYQKGKYKEDSFVVKTEFFDQFISVDLKKVISIF